MFGTAESRCWRSMCSRFCLRWGQSATCWRCGGFPGAICRRPYNRWRRDPGRSASILATGCPLESLGRSGLDLGLSSLFLATLFDESASVCFPPGRDGIPAAVFRPLLSRDPLYGQFGFIADVGPRMIQPFLNEEVEAVCSAELFHGANRSQADGV